MKILLVQTSFLGDTILSTPVIAGLKKIYPDAKIWMMTTPLSSQLVIRDPLLEGVIPFDKRGQDAGFSGLLKMRQKIKNMNFDKVYSLHRSFRTSVLIWLCNIPKRIGFKIARLNFVYHQLCERNPKDHDVIRNMGILSKDVSLESPNTHLRLFAPKKKDVDPDILKTLSIMNKYIVMSPGSAWKTKMWHWQGYHETAKHFLDKEFDVILLGASSDKTINNKVSNVLKIFDYAGKSISDAMYIVKNAKLVICNDSMVLHMASAFKVPNVAIFCATSPKFGFGPWKNNATVVERKDLSCKPCHRHGKQTCPNNTEACMKDLSHVEVINAASKLLDIK
jgi:heptosyltransferase-2